MRNLIIIGMLGMAAFMAGWFKINRDGDRTTIEINRAEIRSDTRKAIDKGREVLDRREQEEQQRYAEQQGEPQGQGYPQPPVTQYNDRGFGQPASYGQPNAYGQPDAYGRPSYPPPSYGTPYPQQQQGPPPYQQR
ncbi:hypothetical protein Poly51_52480 [Rubripirellula tenax]|uniref:Uncharacterized protein n=1 Tax=Rubripirellula tenax TaxID=2528015 RepID=A0A5C6EF27_9BACT|nr:hypothetical protein [Rubripirellula tenax]TWU47448.1 hypothetical protein Poly51_52480 [Rubripirellula tenax]